MKGTNGTRRPPRPRIELVSSAATETEAAALAPPGEPYLVETAPAPAASDPEWSRWQRAALEEGIAARQVSGYAWGHSRLPR